MEELDVVGPELICFVQAPKRFVIRFVTSDVRHLQLNPTAISIDQVDIEPFGLFATRTPRRPNPIGISLVRLDSIDGLFLHIKGIDAYDGTPVLDIKPYLPSIDQLQSEINKKAEPDLGLEE